MFQELVKQTDRGAALIAGELVNTMLRTAISASSPDGVAAEELFDKPNAPLGSFYSRILVGHLMGLYDSSIKDRLQTIRGIRNHFAHALVAHDFSEHSCH